jgi:CRP-like cAMP-binding protein
VKVIAENERVGMNLGLGAGDFDVRMLITPLRALAKSENLWRLRSHAKGDVILDHGAPSGDIFILETGLLKLVYPTANGDEWIKSFIVDQGVFGSVDEGDMAQPSRFAAQAIEQGTHVRLPFTWVQQSIASNTDLTQAYLAFSGWVRRRKEDREEALLCASAEDNYCRFLQLNSNLAQRLPQGDIARYLGVTPIAFSRIKRRMHQ